MNGLPSTNSGSDQSPVETITREQIGSLFRNTSKSSKVIFGALRGVFDLTRNDIENFFHLVDQRVGEQNSCDDILCEVSIYYSDGTSRKFPSIGEFKNYSETKKRIPTVITLHITHLIVFPDNEMPEKQQIDIEIRASESTSETIDMVATDNRVRMAGDKVQFGVGRENADYGIISYTINHSRVSWGLDLEGHIVSQIERLLEIPTKWDVLLNKLAGPLNIITTVFVGLYICNLIIDGFFSFLYKTDGALTPDAILDIAANYLINGQIAKYIVASLVVSIIIFVLFSAFVSAVIRSMKKPKPSFIILDRSDKINKTARLKNYNRRWIKFAGIIAVNLLVALLITFLESRVWEFISILSLTN